MAFLPSGADDGTAPDDVTPWAAAVMFLSHAGFVPLIPFLFWDRLHYLGGTALATFIFSIVYHSCRAGVYCFGLPYTYARLLDHVAANHAVVAVALTALLMYDRGSGAAAVTRTMMPFAIAYAVFAYPFQLQAPLLIAAVVVLVCAYHWFIESALRTPDTARFDTLPLVLALVAAVGGFALYMFTPAAYYQWTHSTWHVLITIALYLAAIGTTKGRARHVFQCCGARRREDTL